jgi:hypothetical protein
MSHVHSGCARASRCPRYVTRIHGRRERAQLQLLFHGWCSSHRSTKILRNMAALLHQAKGDQAAKQGFDGNNRYVLEGSVPMNASKQCDDDASTAAVSLACLQAELRQCEASCPASLLESRITQRNNLCQECAAAKAALGDEQRRNAVLLQQLAFALASAHRRTVSALRACDMHSSPM